MSFFDFDASLPKDRPHNVSAHGFGQAPDAFAGLSSRDYHEDEGEALDFEDTYDGLGEHLDEADDAFNADTFGAGPVGKDFDFSGQTASLGPAPPPSQTRPQPRQPLSPSPPKATMRPAKSGYERYREPDYIPKLEASASIWGQPARSSAHVQRQTERQTERHLEQPEPATSISNVSRNMLSLDEVEAAMRAISKQSTPQPPQPARQYQQQYQDPPAQSMASHTAPQQTYIQVPQVLQRPQHMPPSRGALSHVSPQDSHSHPGPQILQRPQPPIAVNQQTQIPQNFLQRAPLQPVEAPRAPQVATLHNRGPSYAGGPITHPEQLLQVSADERRTFIAEDAKRAKRNHKIHLLSKDNGLMTPQDKNFITRIQLQQLLTATGNVDEQGPEAALAEDFYYQVYSQIRGPRLNPNQPLNQFAQTYLHQTAGRMGNRRYARGGDQIRRMEQQVQRAVEAAKLKPKNKQLVIEGSLGKISFSNAKTPKPLLNIKRQEERRPDSRIRASDVVAGRKATLRNVEAVYSTLMKMEDHERRMPPQTTEESSADEIQEQIEWRARIQQLNATLWSGLKVMEPIDQSKSSLHPFIAILSTPKGKKVLPRVFRQIDDQQRLTILTMIVIHLDMLDVVRFAQPHSDGTQLGLEFRSDIDLFSQAVMPTLFTFISDASLGIVVGLLGLIIERVNVFFIARTKIGLGVLTMFLSRAELIKEAGNAGTEDIEQFANLYSALLDTLEPLLPTIFTTPIDSGEDVYVWQFMAALGICATPEQQPRLVMGVKDRVMDTVTQAKQLPDEVGRPRLDTVNLFMKAIGLDVELLG